MRLSERRLVVRVVAATAVGFPQASVDHAAMRGRKLLMREQVSREPEAHVGRVDRVAEGNGVRLPDGESARVWNGRLAARHAGRARDCSQILLRDHRLDVGRMSDGDARGRELAESVAREAAHRSRRTSAGCCTARSTSAGARRSEVRSSSPPICARSKSALRRSALSTLICNGRAAPGCCPAATIVSTLSVGTKLPAIEKAIRERRRVADCPDRGRPCRPRRARRGWPTSVNRAACRRRASGIAASCGSSV